MIKKIPSFFMRCCYEKMLLSSKIKVSENKIIVEFYCPYCGTRIILESKDGIKIEKSEKPRDIKVFYIKENGVKKQKVIDNGIGFGC